MKVIIAYLLSHESLWLLPLLSYLDPELAKQIELAIQQNPGTAGIVVSVCLLVAFLAKKYLRDTQSKDQALVTKVAVAQAVAEERVRELPNIAKGRAGSAPLLTLLLALSFLSPLALIACGDGKDNASGPSACERELTATKLSLESCLAK
jgi:hypothetical protein